MKKLLMTVGAIALVLLLGGAAFVASRPASRAPSTEKIEATPERLARGKYLVENVANCVHCHSQLDMTTWGMHVVPGTEGGGGTCFDENIGFPGRICAPNITSDEETGLGRWTDGEILRAIREGVSRDGRALFPMMPYPLYRNMSDEDAKSVVAYLRTLPPIRNTVPERVLNPPLNLIVRFMPQPLEGPVAAPDLSDEKARGKYLVEIGGCTDCHTPKDDKGADLPGRYLAGGREFGFPGFAPVTSANITPHASGIGGWTKESFIARFKAHATEEARKAKIAPGRNTPMAWYAWAQLSEADLGAMYEYLRTVPPVENPVQAFAATP